MRRGSFHSSIRPQLSKSDAAAAGSTRWWLQRGSVQTQVKHSEADGGLRGVVGGGWAYIYIYTYGIHIIYSQVLLSQPRANKLIARTRLDGSAGAKWTRRWSSGATREPCSSRTSPRIRPGRRYAKSVLLWKIASGYVKIAIKNGLYIVYIYIIYI